jgi:hypothetical protein
VSRGNYPRLYGRLVPDSEWVSQEDAARELGVSRARVVLLVANDHLAAAKDSLDRPGVTASSVVAEKRWRATASAGARLKRAAADIIGYF